MTHFVDPSNPYWNNPNGYAKTRKKKYTIQVSMPPIGTKVHNFLENSDYVVNENKRFVLTGTVGEQWVIDCNKLAKTYTFEDGTPINKETLGKRIKKAIVNGQPTLILPRTKITTITNANAPTNWAMFIPKQDIFYIDTSWGERLTVNNPAVPHGNGDFILCADAGGAPNLADRWVVNGEIFADTYDMRAFPGMGTAHTIKNVDDPSHPKEFAGYRIQLVKQ